MKITRFDLETSAARDCLVVETEHKMTAEVADQIQQLIRQRLRAPEFTAKNVDGKLALFGFANADSNFCSIIERAGTEGERNVEPFRRMEEQRLAAAEKQARDRWLQLAKQLGFPTE